MATRLSKRLLSAEISLSLSCDIFGFTESPIVRILNLQKKGARKLPSAILARIFLADPFINRSTYRIRTDAAEGAGHRTPFSSFRSSYR